MASAKITAPSADQIVLVAHVNGDRLAQTANGIQGVQGATLQLTDPSGNEVTTCISDQDGDCSFLVPFADLPSTSTITYYAHTVAAPDGWIDGTEPNTVVFSFTRPSKGGGGFASARPIILLRVNPSLPASCGESALKVALVADLSGSMNDPASNPAVDTLKADAMGYVDALAQTDAQIALFTFSTVSPATGSDANFNRPLMPVAGNVPQLKNWIKGWVADGYTNWDDALWKVKSSVYHFDLVIFITDGAPTAATTSDVLADTPPAANAVKALGTRVVVVAVGSGFRTHDVVSISGPNTGNANPASNDYFMTDDWANVSGLFQSLATVCNTPTVTESVTSTRTIHYTGAGELTPSDHSDTITWAKTTDPATGDLVACTTTAIGYPAVESPTIAGYTADQASVAAEPVPVEPDTCPPADSEVTVEYAEVPETEEPGLEEPGVEEPGVEEPGVEEPGVEDPEVTVTVRFFDDDSEVSLDPLDGFNNVLKGKPGDPIVFGDTDAALGYDGAKYTLKSIDKRQVFTANQTISVHVKHKKTVAHVNVDRTIHYSGAGSKTPADVVQTIAWAQTTDLVTGVCTCAASSADYPAVASQLLAGYNADPVAAPELAVTELPEVCPPPSVETAVHYTQVKLTVETGGTSLGTGMLPVSAGMGALGVALLWWLRRRTVTAA